MDAVAFSLFHSSVTYEMLAKFIIYVLIVAVDFFIITRENVEDELFISIVSFMVAIILSRVIYIILKGDCCYKDFLDVFNFSVIENFCYIVVFIYLFIFIAWCIIDVRELEDMAVAGIVVFQIVSAIIGNNIEIQGNPTNAPHAILMHSIRVHPIGLYIYILTLIVVSFICLCYKNRTYKAQIFVKYIIAYFIGIMIIDNFITSSPIIESFDMVQIISLVVISAFSIFDYFRNSNVKKGNSIFKDVSAFLDESKYLQTFIPLVFTYLFMIFSIKINIVILCILFLVLERSNIKKNLLKR
ncbi:MAG: prolipoprotein diacylglyceryl transferase [Intestinibacter sp.]|uniref:prolipoprotein diacylglyceryl transferase family protein n=1 Tax=Intestinibacter sp. TaxID=1965304 RepID=UPI002A7ED2E3|nr:prolipoprotein diacylglyceryl transferase family protein [Intestinibacter sp.]MDY4574328.1 prolipoprotein diacylglyceryl transferase [Intestinibacter sp.]